jgi:hypothetical protein
MSKKPKTPYEELKEYIDDYINFMEKINKKRMAAAEKELEHTIQEGRAFNLLRQNITNLEAHGVS